MSELTERMRSKAETNRHARWPADVESCEDELDEGAAEIERLQNRIADLCERVAAGNLIVKDLASANAEIERLRAERAAVVNALKDRSKEWSTTSGPIASVVRLLLFQKDQEIDRLTRELDASRKALREFGVDFLRVYHDAKGLYQCARRGYRIETTIPYLEEPEAPK